MNQLLARIGSGLLLLAEVMYWDYLLIGLGYLVLAVPTVMGVVPRQDVFDPIGITVAVASLLLGLTGCVLGRAIDARRRLSEQESSEQRTCPGQD